jgi:hypothetical protein
MASESSLIRVYDGHSSLTEEIPHPFPQVEPSAHIRYGLGGYDSVFIPCQTRVGINPTKLAKSGLRCGSVLLR